MKRAADILDVRERPAVPSTPLPEMEYNRRVLQVGDRARRDGRVAASIDDARPHATEAFARQIPREPLLGENLLFWTGGCHSFVKGKFILALAVEVVKSVDIRR